MTLLALNTQHTSNYNRVVIESTQTKHLTSGDYSQLKSIRRHDPQIVISPNTQREVSLSNGREKKVLNDY